MNHFNKLSPSEHERLALLSEECGEVVQAIGKILRHGYESCHPDGGLSNRLLLEKEVGDVFYAIQAMTKDGDLCAENIDIERQKKVLTVKKYLHHQ